MLLLRQVNDFMCAYNFEDTNATPVIHPIACPCNRNRTFRSEPF